MKTRKGIKIKLLVLLLFVLRPTANNTISVDMKNIEHEYRLR